MGTVTEGYSTPTSGVIAPGPAVFLGPSCRVVECLVEKTSQEATSFSKVVWNTPNWNTPRKNLYQTGYVLRDSFHRGRCRGIAEQGVRYGCLAQSQELERCRKRLGSLASVRPAFMDEWALGHWTGGEGEKKHPQKWQGLKAGLGKSLELNCHTQKKPKQPL